MNSRLLAVLAAVARMLEDGGHRFALVGGLAVSVRAEPRFTRDIDLAVAVAGDAQAEALIRDFVTAGYGVARALEHDVLGRLATVRLIPPGEPAEGLVVDLLFSSSSIEEEICSAAEPIEMGPRFTVPVARAGHLLAQKVLARAPDRPQDDLDIRVLSIDLDPVERARCRVALDLITARGGNRGRDLLGDFNRLV